LAKAAPFDLILANILAEPLIQLAPAMRTNLTVSGKIVLSGLLATQENAVAAAYRAQEWQIMDTCPLEEWQTLLVG
jgi:ribosomal protein L11 methyltransferase